MHDYLYMITTVPTEFPLSSAGRLIEEILTNYTFFIMENQIFNMKDLIEIQLSGVTKRGAGAA